MPHYQSIAVQRIRDAVSTGRIMKMTHAEIHAKALAVLNAMPKRMTQGERTYARGYLQALLDALWSEVEFCYRDASGTMFSTARDTARRTTEEFYSTGRGCELGKLESAHIWKGSDKVFTDWSASVDQAAFTAFALHGANEKGA